MSDLFFVCGQIRALESKLLDLSRLDRMIGASTSQDAFRVLVELQYSEYFEENTTVADFQRVIAQGLLETKQLLISGTQDHKGLHFLWSRFDLNNIKRALKRRFEEGASDLGDFTEENGFSPLGTLSEEALVRVVFEGESYEPLRDPFFQVIRTAEACYQNEGRRFVESALDRAYFQVCGEIAQEVRDPFLSAIHVLVVDIANFRNWLRQNLVLKESFSQEEWFDGGSFLPEKFVFDDLESLKKMAASSLFSDEVYRAGEAGGNEVSLFLVALEKSLDKRYLDFLRQSSLGVVSGVVIPYHYFEQRLKNARMIRFILFAKSHGMVPEEIYNTLKSL